MSHPCSEVRSLAWTTLALAFLLPEDNLTNPTFEYNLELTVSHPGLFNPITHQVSSSSTQFTGVARTLEAAALLFSDQHLLQCQLGGKADF